VTVCNLLPCVLPLPRQEEAMKMAGIDVHKKVLMVVVVDTSRRKRNQRGGDSSPCRANGTAG